MEKVINYEKLLSADVLATGFLGTSANTNTLELVSENVAKTLIAPNFRPRMFETIAQGLRYLTKLTHLEVVYEYRKAINLVERKADDEKFFIRMYIIDRENMKYYLLNLQVEKCNGRVYLYDINNNGLLDNEVSLNLTLLPNGNLKVSRMVENSLELPFYN